MPRRAANTPPARKAEYLELKEIRSLKDHGALKNQCDIWQNPMENAYTLTVYAADGKADITLAAQPRGSSNRAVVRHFRTVDAALAIAHDLGFRDAIVSFSNRPTTSKPRKSKTGF